MATIIVMPRLSPTMEEGVLVKWSKNEGDKIAPGDVIAEVETDKANMDFPLEDEGVLLKRLVPEGATVKLGAPVAILGEAGEDISQVLAEAGAQGGGEAKAEAPEQEAEESEEEEEQEEAKEAKPKAKAAPKEAPAAEGGGKAAPEGGQAAKQGAQAQKQGGQAGKQGGQVEKQGGQVEKQGGQAGKQGGQVAEQEEEAGDEGDDASGGAAEGGRIVASPLARRLAGDAGLDIRKIRGSGPGGRIVKRDIEGALAKAKTAPPAQGKAPAPGAQAAQAPQGGEVQPLSMMRKTIARRLVESKQTVPHFYLTAEARVDALWRFREDLNAQTAAAGVAIKVSINDFVIKALARALRAVPAANQSFSDAGLVRSGRVDVGVAVALDEGLITPIVRGADGKSVGAISTEVRDLAERARIKKLRPEEYSGGSFSVSNLGMYGIREFFAIINPPEPGILAVGKIEKRPAVIEAPEGDRVVVERRMTLTLSCDHRVIDGALGAKLLGEIVKGLEQPLVLVL